METHTQQRNNQLAVKYLLMVIIQNYFFDFFTLLYDSLFIFEKKNLTLTQRNSKDLWSFFFFAASRNLFFNDLDKISQALLLRFLKAQVFLEINKRTSLDVYVSPDEITKTTIYFVNNNRTMLNNINSFLSYAFLFDFYVSVVVLSIVWTIFVNSTDFWNVYLQID